MNKDEIIKWLVYIKRLTRRAIKESRIIKNGLTDINGIAAVDGLMVVNDEINGLINKIKGEEI